LTDYLRRQFAYDEWANCEVLAAIRASGRASRRTLELMAHVFSAELLWLERLKQKPQSIPIWPNLDLQQCEAQAADLSRLWREYLGPMAARDLSRSISYKNSKGEAWTSTIERNPHPCRDALGLPSRAGGQPHAR